jgi:ABC-type multidrug transport system ATPase subunit
MEEAEYLCDRICIIDNGKIIALGTVNEVINSCEIHNKITYESEQDISSLLKDELDLVTTFNINARYPDYKQSFYKKCDYDFTMSNIEKIKELRAWLLLILENE